jgi:hypothetical protein
MARALLVEAKMPKCYWFWALREAVIRIDLLPVRPPAPGSPPEPSHKFQELPIPESERCPRSQLPSARAARSTQSANLTTPFELFYGLKPDYQTLYNWGCIDFYRRTRDSSGGRGQFDRHSSVGIAIGRSNHTNDMIFWDPITQRMDVSADYKIDPTAAIDIHFSNFAGESIVPKNHFPLARKFKSTSTTSTTKV